MSSVFILIIAIILILLELCRSGIDSSPVVEGKNAAGQFPFMVHLRFESLKRENKTNILVIANCGGVLIRDDAVLTAAHCIGDVGRKPPKIFARAGIVRTLEERGHGEEIRVKSFIQHEKFVNGNLYGIPVMHDIAILLLGKPFKLDDRYIKLAKLPKGKMNVENKRGHILGWGLTSCGEKSPVLQKATMRSMSQQTCQGYYHKVIITDRVICVISDSKTSSSAKGDSGGPLVVQGTVVGISSFGGSKVYKKGKKEVKKCDPEIPSVYTDVSRYFDWIDEQLKNNPIVKVLKHSKL